MSLHVYGMKKTLPLSYSKALRELVMSCLADEKQRPTSFDLLGFCITHSNWRKTYVSPYGVLITPDFDSTILSSWHLCRERYMQKTGICPAEVSISNDVPPIISTVLQLLSHTGEEGKESMRFIVAGMIHECLHLEFWVSRLISLRSI